MPSNICPITEVAPQQTLIVFDKDGVLLDLNATWMPVIIAVGTYLEKKCGGASSKEDLLAMVGVELRPDHPSGGVIKENSLFAAGTFESMTDVWAKHEPTLAPVFADGSTYQKDMKAIIEETARGTTMAKGAVKETITALKEAGFNLGVATNDNTASTMANLDDLGIKKLFDIIVCADSGHGRKPNGGGLLYACVATNTTPETAIMVGDTVADFCAAREAGYKGFITIADSAPTAPDFIPRTDAVLISVDGLLEIVVG